MAKLTDRQRKQVVADYIECENYSAVARKFNLSVNGVKKIVLADKSSASRFKAKKEQNTLDMLSYLDSKRGKAQEIINNVLDSITKEQIEGATLNARMVVAGVLIDKFTALASSSAESDKVQVNIHFKDMSENSDEA